MKRAMTKWMTGQGRLRASHVVSLIILWTLLISSGASAQAWKAGRASLMKNDVRSAKTQLTAALKAAKTKQELAETYKYLGVAEYMGGDKAAASKSFQNAKTMNPAIQLTDGEVIDESVIPFFKSVRAGGARPAASAAASRGRTPSAGASGISTQKSKRTLIKVISNVPNAQVSLDGIAYGSAGQDIEVSPGTVILELSAAGYKPKAIKVQVAPLTTSSVTVTLEKIPPKPKPQPVPKAIPLPSAQASSGAKNSRQANTKAPGGKNSLFGEEDDFSNLPQSLPQQTAPQVGPQQVIPPPALPQPVAPQQGYGPAPNPYAQQPTYQQPMYQQPVYQQPMLMQPMYPQPMYPQPYAAPYGGYAAPQNPYGYAAPAPAPYQPYAAPAADPYGGYLGPPPEAPSSAPAPVAIDPAPSGGGGGGMPPPPILPSDKPASGAKKSKPASSCGTLITIAPFGAGQFCHGSTAKGLFFLGAEVGALYFYKSNSDAAATYQSKLNSILAERAAARESIAADEQEAYDAETASKESQGKAVIAKAQQNAQYSMISFFALWGVGAIDASINVPSGKATKKSKRKSPRILHSYHLDLEKAPVGTWAMAMPHDTTMDSNPVFQDYLIGYTPTLDPAGKHLQHSLTLGLMWEL